MPAELPLSIVATDADAQVLERARQASYERGSLRELPESWLALGFEASEAGELRVRERFRTRVELRRQDLRHTLPEGPFDLVMCRNLVLTYFDVPLQRETLARIAGCMVEGAALVVGSQEHWPGELEAHFAPWPGQPHTYRRVSRP
jgi:chemotaxis protein methyltransferase CheR